MRHREGERPIPNYRLESFLGEGGYGEVWRAAGPGGVPCALKFIKLDNNAGLKELRSIGLVKRLRHPNLVPLNAVWLRDEDGNVLAEGDNGESLSFRVTGDKELVIAMGLGSGSLADKLAAARAEKAADALPGGLSLRKLLGYMQDAARGIDCLNDPPAHDNPNVLPLVHCDIKPANLLLVGGGVQVCDYGVAKAVGKDIKKTMAAGTAAYAPPELINNDPGLKTDQYSLAITYYELRTGFLPLDETKAMMAHLMGQLDFSRVPSDERAALQQATAMRVTDRFPTCEEFVEALHVATGRTIAGGSGPRTVLPVRGGGQPDTADDLLLEPAPAAVPARPTSDVLRPAGSPVGGYTLEKMLGQGGYGQVWQALDPDRVPCALKVLRDVTGKGRHEYETLVRLRRLDHPNLLRIEQLWVLDEFWAPIPAEQIGRPGGREARRMVIRTPLADKNLFQRLTECRRQSQPGIPPTELLKSLRQAADALDYLNIDQQTQHRDVKPENLLLKGETLWVSDFGLAKVVPTGGTAAQSTSSGMTQEYASPEVLTNKQVTDRSDQYSLAVTYHVLRTGRLPFPPGLSMLDLIKARATGSLDLGDLSDGERPVLRRALSAYPGDRFTTCRELLRELAQALNLTTSYPMATPPRSAPPLSHPPLSHPPRSAPPHKPPSAPGTLEFPSTETRVRFEADPLEPELTSDWATTGPLRTTPRPAAGPRGFREDKPAGGNKLLLGGLAAAVVGAGVAGYFLFPGTPTPPTTLASSTVPPPPPEPPQPTPKPTDAERRKPVADLIAAGSYPDARRKLDDLKADTPALKEWKTAWEPVLGELAAPTPAKATAADLIAAASRYTPAETPAVDDADALRAARTAVVTRYAAAAVPALDQVNDWNAVKTALAAADSTNETVAAGLAEVEWELNKTPPVASLAGGFGDYLRAVGKPDDADGLAKVPTAGDWLTPRRAGTLADRLAEAVIAARKPGGHDNTKRVSDWLLAADAAAGKAGSAGEAVRQRLAVDTVLVLANRPDGKAVATAAAHRLTPEAVKALPPADQAKVWAAAETLGVPTTTGRLTQLAALRQKLTDPKATPEAVAKEVLPKLTDPATLFGPEPSAEVKTAAAELLADAGRTLFRNRDRWAEQSGFGTAAENARRAARLFADAAQAGSRPEYTAWQGIALFQAGGRGAVPAAVARAAGDDPAGLVLRSLLRTAAPEPDAVRSEREAAQTDWATVVTRGSAEPTRYAAELAVAYHRGGENAIYLAHLDPARRAELLTTAAGWGAALTKLEPDRADGPNVQGSAEEDLAWLARTPSVLTKRCGPDGPYARADACFRAGEKCRFGDRKYSAVHRGRNLFKWAEDESQLGKWRADTTGDPKRNPDEARLAAAEAALRPAGDGPEALYWLAEATALRYEAQAVGKRTGDPGPAARSAINQFKRVVALTDEAAADWRRDAGPRLAWLYETEARRLALAGRPAEAAPLAEAAGWPKAKQAGLFAEAAQALLAEADKGGDKAALWPKAARALEAALDADRGATDAWRWRFDLGRLEHWAAGQAANAPAALDRYALAVNQLRGFLFDGFERKRLNPALENEYDRKKKEMGDLMKTAGEQLAQVDPAKPLTGQRAVWLLAQLDWQVDRDNSREIVGVSAADKKRAEELRQVVDKDKAALDPAAVTAARDLATRVGLFPTKN